MDYDVYNREERYVCSHLFRLLHEPVDNHHALSTYLKRPVKPNSFRIYAEVALLRDAYYARKPHTGEFLDELVRMIMVQENVFDECRLYTELPKDLNNTSLTHPKQIRQKAGDSLSRDEGRVYGALQGMFNAKPDLAICIDDDLLIYEAKLTLDFDREQLERTKNIAKVWAKLLFKDLGFVRSPNVQVLKLGLSKYKPDVSWQEIADIANTVYPAGDRTRSVLAHAAAMASVTIKPPLHLQLCPAVLGHKSSNKCRLRPPIKNAQSGFFYWWTQSKYLNLWNLSLQEIGDKKKSNWRYNPNKLKLIYFG